MNTIDQAGVRSAQRVRWPALRLVLGACTAVGAILGPAFRRRVAAAAAAAAVAASSLLTAHPAAAAGVYYVDVEFEDVTFAHVDDGCYGWLCLYTDTTMEIYGSVTARTSALGGGPWNWAYRNFGTWGKDPWSCPAQAVAWDSTTNGPCLKKITEDGISISSGDAHAFNDVLLCSGKAKDSCATAYNKNNNHIVLVVQPDEGITVNFAMQDYDSASANDTVCTGGKGFGPFSSSQLASLYVEDKIHIADNGDAECQVKLKLRSIPDPFAV